MSGCYWLTVDAAIRAALHPPSIGISYERVQGDRYQAAERQRARTMVLAVLARLPKRERAIVEAYAMGFGYQQIARKMGISTTTVWRSHRAARKAVQRRLVELEIIPA